MEADTYTRPALSGASVTLSDFTLPNWYRPGTRGPYDFLRLVRKPLKLRHGGYQSFWSDVRGDWDQIFADRTHR